MSAEEEGSFRHLDGLMGQVQKALLIAIPVSGTLFVLDVHTYLTESFYDEQYLGIFLGLVLSSIFLGLSATRGVSRGRIPWYDLVLAAVSLGVGLFITVTYPKQLLAGLHGAGPEYMYIATLSILLVIEATRRTTGWMLVALVVVFIFYACFTHLFPAPLYGKSLSWNYLSVYLYLDNSALVGLPIKVVASMVLAFILLGAILLATGTSALLNNLAMAGFGRFRGGPAKMAVVGSSLFGTISGSAVANVAATGIITIPLMKKCGYKAEVAAAIEAAASTGSQLLPPVMGVTAFIIAEFLRIPYSEVAIAAAIPAILYYVVLFFQVDLAAAKYGIRGLTTGIPPLLPTLKRIWMFAVPLIVLVYTLFLLNFQPGKAAIAGAASALILSFSTKQTRVGLHKVLDFLEVTGRDMLMLGAVTALAGLVVGAIYITGIASVLSLILLKLGGQNLFLLLFISALVSIILGMGLPTAVLYIILAVLVGPAMIQLGILPLAAHLFIFYFGLMSMVTPPIAFAAFAAAAIAKASVVKTGFHATRLALAAYIIPFIFVYNPALILKGPVAAIAVVVLQSLLALILVTIAINGFIFQPLNWIKRGMIGVGAIGLLLSTANAIPVPAWLLSIGGLVLSIPILFWEWRKRISGKVVAIEAR